MLTLSEFFRLEYAPAFLKDRDKRTLTAYKSSINLVVELLDDPTINEVGLYGSVFVRDAIKRGLSAAKMIIPNIYRQNIVPSFGGVSCTSSPLRHYAGKPF